MIDFFPMKINRENHIRSQWSNLPDFPGNGGDIIDGDDNSGGGDDGGDRKEIDREDDR